MHGEETGRQCRQEVSGRPARPNLELSIRQVDLVNGMGVHRRGEMNSNTHLRARIEALQDHTQCGERALPIAADSHALLSHLPAFSSAILVRLFLSR